MRTALVLSPRSLRRRIRLLEHLSNDTLMSHLITLGALFPNTILGSLELSRLFDRLSAAWCERCERLFARAPSVLQANDLETHEMRSRLIDGVRALGDATTSDDVGPPVFCLIGRPEKDRAAALLFELERARLGSATPWILMTELLGTSIRCRGEERAVLAEYRAALTVRLSSFAEQPPEIFLRALVAGRQTELGNEFRGVVGALRGAVSLVL